MIDHEEPLPSMPQYYGVFWTESDSPPFAIFRHEEDAIKYAKTVDAPGENEGYHYNNGNVCVLRCSLEGTCWNSCDDDPLDAEATK